MRFLLLICGDESAAAHAADGCEGWSSEMTRRGVLRDGAGLAPPSAARTVRVRRRELLVTDGPFAECKEQVGGWNVIDCESLDEAVSIASAHPAARYGSIVIRPIL